MIYPHKQPFQGAALAAAALAALVGGAALASDLSTTDPAGLLEAAAGNCLMNIQDIDTAVDAFSGTGWEVGELDGGAWEMLGPAPGIYAFANLDGYCRVEAEGIPLDEVRETARLLLHVTYPDQFKDAGPGPCDGYVVTTTDGLVTVALDGLGQDPVCPDPAGASIVIEAER